MARKREVALRLLMGESVDALSRELGVEIYRLEKWREKALSGIDADRRDVCRLAGEPLVLVNADRRDVCRLAGEPLVLVNAA